MRYWKLIAGIVLIFLLGAAAGSIVTHGIYRRAIRKKIDRVTSGPAALRHELVRHLGRELGLTAKQKTAVEQAILEAQREFQTIRKDVQPQVEAIVDRAEVRIRGQLDPGQRTKLDRLIAAKKQRWKKPRLEEPAN